MRRDYHKIKTFTFYLVLQLFFKMAGSLVKCVKCPGLLWNEDNKNVLG